MRRAGGYLVITEPGKATFERDTFTCGHCNAVVIVEPMCDPSELGGFCRLCMGHVCGPCADQGSCDPFEKKLERMEARGRLLRAIEGA